MSDKSVMIRHATDDFQAMQTAQCMEDMGGDVFSITYTGIGSFPYCVWAKVEEGDMIRRIDNLIERTL